MLLFKLPLLSRFFCKLQELQNIDNFEMDRELIIISDSEKEDQLFQDNDPVISSGIQNEFEEHESPLIPLSRPFATNKMHFKDSFTPLDSIMISDEESKSCYFRFKFIFI